MALNRHTNVIVNDEDEEEELQFKDSFPGFSDAPILSDEEHSKLLPEEQPAKISFWEFKYYQSLFDVDTKQVVDRMMWSVIPRPGGATYLHRLIRPNPDLYGPFWICATLVFTIAVSNNVAEYLRSLGTEKAVAYYDYRKVSFTATTLYSYTFLLPLAIWGMLWYLQSTAQLSILEVTCVYGYSLAVYIPISILWIVKLFWFQLVLIVLGFSLSTAVMMLTFWPVVRETRKKISGVILLIICLFHAVLCFGFVVYFFQPHDMTEANKVPITIIPKDFPPSHQDMPAQNTSIPVKSLHVKSERGSLTTFSENDTKTSSGIHQEKTSSPNTSQEVSIDANKKNSPSAVINNKVSDNSKREAQKMKEKEAKDKVVDHHDKPIKSNDSSVNYIDKKSVKDFNDSSQKNFGSANPENTSLPLIKHRKLDNAKHKTNILQRNEDVQPVHK